MGPGKNSSSAGLLMRTSFVRGIEVKALQEQLVLALKLCLCLASRVLKRRMP